MAPGAWGSGPAMVPSLSHSDGPKPWAAGGHMPELEIVTLRSRQSQTLSSTGQIVTVMSVDFMVGDHGPFTLDFRPGDFTPENVKAGQERIATTVRAISPATSTP